jgi:hypothetical protein
MMRVASVGWMWTPAYVTYKREVIRTLVGVGLVLPPICVDDICLLYRNNKVMNMYF